MFTEKRWKRRELGEGGGSNNIIHTRGAAGSKRDTKQGPTPTCHRTPWKRSMRIDQCPRITPAPVGRTQCTLYTVRRERRRPRTPTRLLHSSVKVKVKGCNGKMIMAAEAGIEQKTEDLKMKFRDIICQIFSFVISNEVSFIDSPIVR